jgi:thioredoxin-dependent peroxiredoxin
MSKKTRKKTGKSLAVKKTPSKSSKAKTKQPVAKAGRSPAAKPSKNSKKGQTKATAPSSKASKTSTSNRTTNAALAVGATAPSFHLPRDGGNTVSLADFAGQQLVLFFYPRADTPGCTKEAIDFTRLKAAFATAGTAVVGVSGDAPKAQEAFRTKHQLSVPLASDEKHEMLEAYGAWGEKSMYGRTFEGIIRTTVLIGRDGKVVRIWRHVKVDGHADEVLAAARST